jgi:hypothetical protein
MSDEERTQSPTQALEECRRFFDGGDPRALIEAIRLCFAQRMPAPEWVVEAFFTATNRWYALDAETLDESFGVAKPKGHISAERKRRALLLAVYAAVTDAHKKGRSIDDALLEEVGRGLKPPLGKTLAWDYYRKACAALRNPIEVQMLAVTWAMHFIGEEPLLRK